MYDMRWNRAQRGLREPGRRRRGNALSACACRGRGLEPHDWTDTTMNRVVAIAACGLSLAACSGAPSWMPFELPRASLGATMVQLESQPPGAEARASTGQACRTPCAISVPPSDFTVSFALPGYQPQTVPVRLVTSTTVPDRTVEEAVPQAPRLAPNPVYAELMPAPPPPPRKKLAPPKKKPNPAPRTPTAMAPPPPPPPAASSPWPPPPPR
jgi:hypothetical protein